MKKLLLGLAAGTVGWVVSSAAFADGPVYRPGLKDYAAPTRCASFQGFYLGGNVGWGYYDWKWSDRDAWAKNEVELALPSAVSSTDSGVVGGVQGGYNWQRGCTVFGFEADWSAARLRKSTLNTDGQPGNSLDLLAVSSEIKSFGTIRTRAGIVVDNLLLYTTAGVAYVDIKSSWTATDLTPGTVAVETFSTSDTRWGWTAGVGTEWAIAHNISIKSEALYLRFDEDNSTFRSARAVFNGNNPVRNFDHEDTAWVGRVGVNFRFGCGESC